MNTFEHMLGKIDRALSAWETTKGAHGLSPEVIEQGNQILKELKEAKESK